MTKYNEEQQDWSQMTSESTIKKHNIIIAYNSITQMINDLGWRDLADRRRDTRIYAILHDCEPWSKASPEDILILTKGATWTSQ